MACAAMLLLYPGGARSEAQVRRADAGVHPRTGDAGFRVGTEDEEVIGNMELLEHLDEASDLELLQTL